LYIAVPPCFAVALAHAHSQHPPCLGSYLDVVPR
jgi:hypothetical protein